jgi:hypothetical protein
MAAYRNDVELGRATCLRTAQLSSKPLQVRGSAQLADTRRPETMAVVGRANAQRVGQGDTGEARAKSALAESLAVPYAPSLIGYLGHARRDESSIEWKAGAISPKGNA